MRSFWIGFGSAVFLGVVGAALFFVLPAGIAGNLRERVQESFLLRGFIALPEPEKTPEELHAEALERSGSIKGLYMTADVASGEGPGPERMRKYLVELAERTEINGLVIDVKEVCGPDYDAGKIKALLAELKQKNIWTIARVTVFKDASQVKAHPEWYLKRASAGPAVGAECSRKRHLVVQPTANSRQPTTENTIFWRDKRGGWWLDPASQGAREYILSFSKEIIDLGFDELQFDYIRFPSDGDIQNAVYPAYDGKTPKHAVMKSFFEYLSDNLRAYKPGIILSADLFGYVAAVGEDKTIGQRLSDIGANFDYVSFMVYPSHYYSGFFARADAARGLPEIFYTPAEARENPGVVVGRSLLFAQDYFAASLNSTSTATTTALATTSPFAVQAASSTPRAPRLRPWLEDFFHEEDRTAGRPWGAEKVRLQIDAAEAVEDHGWLLWNAANVYSEGALLKN